jgi:hypothetical protein
VAPVNTRRKFSWKGLLSYIDAESEAFFPTSRKAVYRHLYHPKYVDFDKYFPYEIVKTANRLERKGLVTIEKTGAGIKVKVTNKGKTEILKFEIDQWQPKKEVWDSKWRLVFFDIEETKSKKRKQIVHYLKQLGMQEMQRSVYISPYDISKEIQYLREIFDVPGEIKYGVLEFLENSEDLKIIFGL